jgi:hypothetical protein
MVVEMDMTALVDGAEDWDWDDMESIQARNVIQSSSAMTYTDICTGDTINIIGPFTPIPSPSHAHPNFHPPHPREGGWGIWLDWGLVLSMLLGRLKLELGG